MNTLIKGRVEITQIKWDRRKVARALANDPKVKRMFMAKATQVAADTRSNIASTPKRPVAKQRVGGYYFSERPDAIARLVHVGGMEGPFIITQKKNGEMVPVALIAADHPYSVYYTDRMVDALKRNATDGFKVFT